jgi:hypothetical protein
MKTRLTAVVSLIFAALLLVGSIAAPAAAQTAQPTAATAAATAADPKAATAKIVAASNAFIAMLTDAEKAKAVFAFDDTKQKTNWSNLPGPMYVRNSLRIGDLTAAKRDAVMAILAAALSGQGYQKVVDIMNGDEYLKTTGGGIGGGTLTFGKDNYFIAFLGTPSETAPWMLQFGGHHLAINATIVGANITMSPSLIAVQPGSYPMNGVTVRALGDEWDKAVKLLKSLSTDQQKAAVLAYAQKDLILGPGQDGKVTQTEGIKGSDLSAEQQAMLLDVITEWVGIVNDASSAATIATIKANMAETYFAWSGATDGTSAAYYRIQGPTVIIEFAPQGGGPGGGSTSLDHIHTIYRDPTNEYGVALVK